MHASIVVLFGLAGVMVFKVCAGGVLVGIVPKTSQQTDGDAESIEVASSDSQEDVHIEDFKSILRREMQQVRPIKATMAGLLTSLAEAFSVLSAVPIVASISFVNRVAKVTNQTLHFGGELTKLPLTITNSIIQELSNITFPY